MCHRIQFREHLIVNMSYVYSGPVDTTIAPDKVQLKGKSVVVTGGLSLPLPSYSESLDWQQLTSSCGD